MTYRQFAAEIGAPVTEAAVKKWPQRKKFPADVARLIVTRARERVGLPAAPQGPQGQFSARIARALEADLSHNELGQWSSLEVQRTVIWALKDLARRLWVLRFSMGETFELTDDWAGKIGLPVRPSEPSSSEGNEPTASPVALPNRSVANRTAEA